MTYNQLIDKIRNRGYQFLKDTPYYELGAVYDAIHDALRLIVYDSKEEEATANLSLVAGTKDYTISSAIASDVDSIIYLTIDTGEITPKIISEFQEEIHNTVEDEDDATTGIPSFYRIFNGVLRVFPTPSEAKTATVYYHQKIAADFYTTAIGATTIPIQDEYIEPVIYEALAVLSENIGNINGATYYRTIGKDKLTTVQVNRPAIGFSVKFHDLD